MILDSDIYPHVVIGVITYERLMELQLVLNALLENVIYPKEKLHFVICDDSSPSYNDKIHYLCQIPAYSDMTFIRTPKRGGWGRNANFLIHYCLHNTPAQYMLFIEDDYVLTRPLDLRRGAGFLEKNPRFGMLRYRGTAGTKTIYAQSETDISAYVDTPDITPKNMQYLEILGTSPTLWIYSNGTHLKRLHGKPTPSAYYHAFHGYYGSYPVGLSLGETEVHFAHRVKDGLKASDSAPAIAIFPDWIPMFFDHIGKTFKETTDDIKDNPTHS